MKGAPRSEIFNDVYFSAVDGLEEARYVFLKSNDLPFRWESGGDFTICETGFGTGLNFLAAWQLFSETAKPGQKLHFISFEKYPLSVAQIKDALEVWRLEFPTLLEIFLEAYPTTLHGKQTFDLGNAQVTIIFGDVNEEMPKLETKVDCWFLDGFRPRTNPEMWSDIVFSNMARLSAPGATFATFTSAGIVKRGLREAGFRVDKVRGFGTKWHMLRGVKL